MLPTFAYGFGTQELLIIGGLVILLFGGAKLPQLAKGLGEGIREFKKSVNGEESSRNDVPAETKKDEDR
jgi:sec-independent protein translocase protein TatA